MWAVWPLCDLSSNIEQSQKIKKQRETSFVSRRLNRTNRWSAACPQLQKKMVASCLRWPNQLGNRQARWRRNMMECKFDMTKCYKIENAWHKSLRTVKYPFSTDNMPTFPDKIGSALRGGSVLLFWLKVVYLEEFYKCLCCLDGHNWWNIKLAKSAPFPFCPRPPDALDWVHIPAWPGSIGCRPNPLPLITNEPSPWLT